MRDRRVIFINLVEIEKRGQRDAFVEIRDQRRVDADISVTEVRHGNRGEIFILADLGHVGAVRVHVAEVDGFCFQRVEFAAELHTDNGNVFDFSIGDFIAAHRFKIRVSLKRYGLV